MVAVVVRYQLFAPVSSSVTLAGDATLDFVVRVEATDALIAGAVPIHVGDVVTAAIDASLDPFCEHDWDAHSPCKQFVLVPQVNQDIRVLLEWAGAADELELHLIGPDFVRMLGRPSPSAPLEIDASVRVYNGYEIRVMAYYGPSSFRLSISQR